MPKIQSDLVNEYEKFVSERIQELRVAKGYSASELSYAAEQSRNYISNVENGLSAPSMHSFFFICECLDIRPDKFFAPMANDDEVVSAAKDMMAVFSELNSDDQNDILKMARKINQRK